MPRSDVTPLTKLSYLKKIRNQPSNTNHRQMAEITGVPKSTTARVTQQQEQLRDEWTLRRGQQGTSQKRKREGMGNWTRCTCQRSMLKSKSEELTKHPGHNDFKVTD
jgi:hypothetical protein